MYNNGYNNQVRKVKSTPAVWALRAFLVLTYAGSSVGIILQIHDSAKYGMFGSVLGNGGLTAVCVIAGIVLTAIRYGLFDLLLRLGRNSLVRNFAYIGETALDPNYLYMVAGTSFVIANAGYTLFSVLRVFYTYPRDVASAYLALALQVLAAAAAMLLFARQAGKANFSFVFAALAPLFAVTVILL